MASILERRFVEELSTLLQKTVTVVTSQGESYVGVLSGIETNTLSLVLTDARDSLGRLHHKLIIYGGSIARVYISEKPFDLAALAERLERVFPKMVRLVGDAGVIVVMDKVRITEKGIIEGSGPVAERAQKVYEEFIREQQDSKKQR